MAEDDWSSVREWHRAVNERDLAAARRPKGAAEGVEVFTDWITRSGIHLEPVSWHPVARDRIVVEQDATWPDAPDAESRQAPPVRTATLFVLDGDRVAAALRYDDGLHAALRAADGG
ncbi:nuclear transport factor 2 family protein [Streptomonospora sp. S1-112]|uniref:Nuclear transport factor 2 family protein n=1 Tax=Streptomonospora mangrovi TaxID=2883123 RepID=A0A9X3NS75_9ACTN|nr:nuclear transport factor 2 family protein [Streptomonospora mangrovi]MDA0565850.1 nuclear transport factor 2 family protein [Streptomonospora mangrovi]